MVYNNKMMKYRNGGFRDPMNRNRMSIEQVNRYKHIINSFAYVDHPLKYVILPLQL